MDYGNGGIDLGGLGIWLFLAALVIASAWKKIRGDAEKHETLRRIVEKTGTVDEAQLNALFRPAVPQQAVATALPGAGYRILRILGILIMGGAAALFSSIVVGLLLGLSDGTKGVFGGFVIATFIGIFGLGVFLSARFATPPDRGNGPAR